jgi:hypothetical protein
MLLENTGKIPLSNKTDYKIFLKQTKLHLSKCENDNKRHEEKSCEIDTPSGISVHISKAAISFIC